MRARDFLKLHNGDEVIVKTTGEVLTLVGNPKPHGKYAVAEARGPVSGMRQIDNLEVK